MICECCLSNDIEPHGLCCKACEPGMREAFALLFAGLEDLFRAHREQEAAEKEAAHVAA